MKDIAVSEKKSLFKPQLRKSTYPLAPRPGETRTEHGYKLPCKSGGFRSRSIARDFTAKNDALSPLKLPGQSHGNARAAVAVSPGPFETESHTVAQTLAGSGAQDSGR